MLSRYGAHYAVEKVCNSICMAFAYDLHIIFNEREICAFSLITWNIAAYFCYALVETRYDYASLVIKIDLPFVLGQGFLFRWENDVTETKKKEKEKTETNDE